VRVMLVERTSCRHGVQLKHDCSECAKTPEVARTWFPSDELDGLPLGTAEEERWRAKQWMDSAAQHARGEAYLKKERDELLRFVQVVAGRLAGMTGDMQAVWERNKMLVEGPPSLPPASGDLDSGTLSSVEPGAPKTS
jgi:hypothetical protein